MNHIKRSLLSLVFVAACTALFFGCANIQPGEDPLVVRCEQTEATAKASFDMVLNIDHADRGFWKTNAPAFHSFCEWLRQPQVVNQTNELPRASAMIWSLNNVKVNYQIGRQTSNDVVTALLTLQGAVNEAQAWVTVTKND